MLKPEKFVSHYVVRLLLLYYYKKSNQVIFNSFGTNCLKDKIKHTTRTMRLAPLRTARAIPTSEDGSTPAR